MTSGTAFAVPSEQDLDGYLHPVLVLAAKDILLEARTKDVLLSVAMFGVVILVVFNLALDITPALAARLAPGVLWVSFAFAGVLAMNRAFAAEKERGSLEGLLLCPVSGDVLFFGKMLGMLVFMLIVQAVLLPIYGIMFDFVGFTPALGLSVLLVTVGFATVGTLFAAIAVQTRSREIMLPTLFFPIVGSVINCSRGDHNGSGKRCRSPVLRGLVPPDGHFRCSVSSCMPVGVPGCFGRIDPT